MLGGQDHRGVLAVSGGFERRLKFAHRGVDVVQGLGHQRTRGGAAGEVTAGHAVRRRELLRCGDGLEVQAEDGRDGRRSCPGVVLAVDFVQDCLDFVAVVLLGGGVVLSPVAAERSRSIGIDLRGEEVVHTFAGRAVEDFIGRVLVGPCGCHAGVLGDFENSVHLQILVRVNRSARRRVNREGGRVQEAFRVAGHGQDARGKAAEALPGIEGHRVLVRSFGERHLGAGCCVPAVGSAGREQGPVERVVVVHARGAGVSARQLAHEPRERVRRDRRLGVGVAGAVIHQPGEGRRLVVLDEPVKVLLVHAVHRNQQDVLGHLTLAVAAMLAVFRQGRRSRRPRQNDGTQNCGRYRPVFRC